MNRKILAFLIPTLLFSFSSCDKNDDGGNDQVNHPIISLAPDIWNSDGAWFAAYCWNSDGTETVWYTLNSNEEYYSSEIDVETYINVVFVRFSNTASEATWDIEANIWNQTIDLTFEGDVFTITSWGDNSSSFKSTGTWSTRGS